MKLFSYDNPFMTSIRHAIDYFFLGLLWIVMSIPLFTFGAATTAALQTAESSIRKDGGKILFTFVKQFRIEFKQATLLLILAIPIFTILIFNILGFKYIQASWLLRGLICVASLIVFSWLQLWFGYLSKFDDNNKTLLSNTFRILFCSLGQSLLAAILALVALTCCSICLYLFSPLLFIIPGCYIAAYSALMRKLFAKYLPSQVVVDEKPIGV